MIVTIASGKGGTGKTTVTVNLAAIAPVSDIQVFDCDVEEPNSHIYLKPENITTQEISTMIPVVDKELCNLCGECEKLCQFSAIALIAGKIMTFPEMCHSCRGCAMVCPEGAINEGKRVLGSLLEGKNQRGIELIWGELRVGEAMSPPLIKQVKQRINPEKFSFVDAPPGTSCPAIETLRDSDFAILVSEPTPFGLNDLALTVEVLKKLNVPTGIVINRADTSEPTSSVQGSMPDTIIDEYAEKEGIEILQKFPFSREAARVSSKGLLLVDEMPEMKKLFQELYDKIMSRLDAIKEKNPAKQAEGTMS
ncbi:MinD2 [Desulfamplus magnetovallimortis]|uniref:MinD2 n=1 Tax=Desulfamplus magnetovallimortis TaxID=1246637 RepID=A0A1W1HB35_9BACT|nr:ATP-binding protein [Desulfamplus magnetovallimortis]SLM29711.1 MinD2 [Desulfamplus magnetovallimortis]